MRARYALVPGLLAALVMMMTACASADSGPGPEPDAAPATTGKATPSPSPGSTGAFESDRHAYRLDVPPGWEVTEYDGTWTRWDQFMPGSAVPGEDVVAAPDIDAWLVANSMEMPDGTRPAAWMTQLDRLVDSGRPPGCQQATGRHVLGGRPATITTHRCEDFTIMGRALTHRGRGYYFTIGFPPEDATAAATLDELVSSIRFLEP